MSVRVCLYTRVYVCVCVCVGMCVYVCVCVGWEGGGGNFTSSNMIPLLCCI